MKRILSIFMLTMLLVVSFELPSKAGEVSTISNLVGENGALNATDWFDPNDELKINDGMLVIPNESTVETRMISKVFSRSDSICEELEQLLCDVEFTQLPEGEKFIFGFGLPSVEAYSGESGNVEVEFSNKNGIRVGITTYDESGNAQEIAEPKACGVHVGSKVAVKIIIRTDKHIAVTVNGKEVLTGTLPVTGEGRVGLLQTGNCGAKISNLRVKFTQYDRPENPEFVETFEEGIYNNNLFIVKHVEGQRTPSALCVEEYEGSNVLRFRNTGLSYFGTKYTYSNFELTFDIPYFVRQFVRDETGNVLEAPTMFGVSMGDTAKEFANYEYGYAGSTDLIYFEADYVYSHNQKPVIIKEKYSDMGFFDKNTNEGFSIRIRMVDGHLTVGMKALEAEDFKVIAEADYEDMRTGYIKMWTLGDGNVAVDNIQIKNLDREANVIEVPFKAALIEVEDYVYQEEETVFMPEAKGESEEVKEEPWKAIVTYTVIGSVSILAVSAILMLLMIQKKRKNSAEVKADEVS